MIQTNTYSIDSFENILLVGTSHIAQESIKKIKSNFLSHKPEIIAIELDKRRLYTLLHPETQAKIGFSLIKTMGVKGFLFTVIARYAQKRLGKMVGMQPGEDMKFATELAHNNEIQLALIDKPIEQTIRKLMKTIRFREWLRLVGDVVKGLLFGSKQEKVKINLREVPKDDLIVILLEQLKDRYPSFYSVLVDERNHFMARQLTIIHKKYPDKNILVVIGAGHKKGILDLLPKYALKIENPKIT